MSDPSPLTEPRALLRLARTDRQAATRALASLSLEAQVAMVCEAPAEQRATLLGLAPEPEALIPLLPEAELCFTVKALGIEDASWIMEYTTADQIVACADLDAWRGLDPDLPALDHWFAVLAEAGDVHLLRAAQALDAELSVLYLRARIEVTLKPSGDEDWQPPEASQTVEGQFYFSARSEGDDLSSLVSLLRALFEKDYWLYFRLMQGTIWELPSDLEEWALRWRTGRLEDLGFPPWDAAMRIYGHLRPDQRAQLGEESTALDVEGWNLPVWLPRLPASREKLLLFRAVAELGESERLAFFYAFIALANKVAIADRMPLGDAETLPTAIEKAAEVIDAGLQYVVRETGVAAGDVLRRATLERLFRVGVSDDPTKLPLRDLSDD